VAGRLWTPAERSRCSCDRRAARGAPRGRSRAGSHACPGTLERAHRFRPSGLDAAQHIPGDEWGSSQAAPAQCLACSATAGGPGLAPLAALGRRSGRSRRPDWQKALKNGGFRASWTFPPVSLLDPERVGTSWKLARCDQLRIRFSQRRIDGPRPRVPKLLILFSMEDPGLSRGRTFAVLLTVPCSAAIGRSARSVTWIRTVAYC
jgi:hypothetical protein